MLTDDEHGGVDPRGSRSDLTPEVIERAASRIPMAFRSTPVHRATDLSTLTGRNLLLKDETVTPIGSFKGRGTSLLAQDLDPSLTWVCATAGNFGLGLAYAARAFDARVVAYVSGHVSRPKIEGMRALGATVRVVADPEGAAAEDTCGRDDRELVVDGRTVHMGVGAGTIAAEIDVRLRIDLAVIQVGDGALISGIGCWLKNAHPAVRVVGVCAQGAPAMAESFAARRPITVPPLETAATAIGVSVPSAESLARVLAVTDEVVTIDDLDLISGQELIRSTIGTEVELAGAAGLAALIAHNDILPGQNVLVVLTGRGH